MKQANVKFPWWIKWMMMKVFRWLVRTLLEEVEEGFYIRLPIDDRVVYIYIKLEKKPEQHARIVMLM